ncbi:LuxR C-terminal-related transcriptional regulator [Vogesella sp. LIG4]|uniref:helix-turn-helix transcriptional regulator n=1 Tax=Vogesella sp. LIG4 TaxID=1192162 RepID=UPI00081FD018|nr:LuxR C-terminal-related transcriptional regulator [Vogesella sp. LIG4]SCK29803.1 Response regulator containing a CheY-like receiver domain and an HTH DNA-binding domain [Vogesella sp. LIG4]
MASLQLPVDTAARLVSQLGNSGFPLALWDWINTLLPIGHLSSVRYNQPAAGQQVESVDWLFSRGYNDQRIVEQALTSYLSRHWRQDPLLAHVEQLLDPQLVLIRNSDITADDYAMDGFNQPQVIEECNLLGRSADGVYVLAVYRQIGQTPFTLEELSLLRQLGELIVPLVVQHARLTVSTQRSQTQALTYLFDRRLATEGIRLSPRELSICHCLLLGLSSSRIAEQLAVRPSSVKTYVERAFLKLGVSSRAELYAWSLQYA